MNGQDFDCHFCGGKVTTQQVDVMRRWKGRYLLIENVPAHVCTQCGERYYNANVAEAMDSITRASETEIKFQREICVPVIEMTSAYSPPQQTSAAVHNEPCQSE